MGSLFLFSLQVLYLIAATLAVDSDEASLIAWKAYGDLIKTYITVNQPLTPGTDFIYVNPPTSNFVRGGTPCPGSVMNFELYDFADHLQNTSSPLLGTEGPSYHQSLESYLKSVAVTDVVLTPEQRNRLNALEKTVTDATTKFRKQRNTAYLTWSTDEVARHFNQSFQSWVIDNDPQYSNYRSQMATADVSYNSYKRSIYGSKYDLLEEQIKNINERAQNDATVPGYNMMVYPSANDYAVRISPFIKQDITDFVAYRPAYSLGGYEDTCDAYFTGTSTGFTSLQYGFRNVDGHDWSSLGYQRRVSRSGGGFFGLLGYKSSAESETTYFNSWSGSWIQDVRVTITMKGAPILVPITAGYWDVGNVRRTYPKLRPGEPDELAGLVRLTHALIGYRVGLQITFSNAETWRNVSQFIETGRKSKGGALQVFGFAFGASGGGAYQFSQSDLQTSSTSDGGVITIPNTPEGMLFLLGARGKAL